MQAEILQKFRSIELYDLDDNTFAESDKNISEMGIFDRESKQLSIDTGSGGEFQGSSCHL